MAAARWQYRGLVVSKAISMQIDKSILEIIEEIMGGSPGDVSENPVT